MKLKTWNFVTPDKSQWFQAKRGKKNGWIWRVLTKQLNGKWKETAVGECFYEKTPHLRKRKDKEIAKAIFDKLLELSNERPEKLDHAD